MVAGDLWKPKFKALKEDSPRPPHYKLGVLGVASLLSKIKMEVLAPFLVGPYMVSLDLCHLLSAS